MADKNIPIIPLKESDIISQSVNTINQNFKTIVNNYDIANFKWEQYSKKITDEIEKLKRHCDKSNIDISRSVDSLNTRIDNITDLNDIQTQINNAIMNANLELTGFISDLAGQQVANAMGGYVKTSSLDNKLKGYVASSAFETYKSDAKNRTASSSLIVANSKFATIKYNNKDYLINNDDTGSRSQYQTIEEYWEKEVKNTYPDLSDEDTLKNFIGNCETKFKTVSTELANISAKVGQGSAQVDIIAAVEGEGGEQIVGAIITKANQSGSLIGLNADRIHLDANHKLTLKSGTFEINSSNFTLNDNGLILRGKNGNTSIDRDGILRAQGAIIQGAITADKFVAESTKKISISNGETGKYEGNVTKRTSINSDEFVIETSGVLKDTQGSQIDVTGNKLYIKMVDKLVNNNTDIKDVSGKTVQYLYGVPVLCMMYNGVEYPLSPASWFKEPVDGENPTDMYFFYVEDTYKSVSAKGSFFFNTKNSYNKITLTPCKKYKFAYDLGGLTKENATQYLNILSTAGLINSNDERITTIDVSPSGLIKTSQSVAKIPITTEGEYLKKFKNNIKSSCDIYQKFTDDGKEYFGNFSNLPNIDDVGNTTKPAYTVPGPIIVPWFNDSIFTFLKNDTLFGTGNWDYEGDLGEYVLSEPQITNPFSTSITGGICGSMEYNITGYYRKHYKNGFEDSTDTAAKNGFAECEYLIKIYFIESESNTISLQRISGGNDTFYMTDMEVRISFGKYMSNVSSSSNLISEIQKGTISNVNTDVHIEAVIDTITTTSIPGIVLVYSNN